MTFVARRTNEYMEWRGKEYPISNVKVAHAFHPVPSDVSPSTQTYLRASLDMDLSNGSANGTPSPFTNAYPHRGDTVRLVLRQNDDQIQNVLGNPAKRYSTDQTQNIMDLLIDSIEFGDVSATLNLTQRIDGLSNKINSDPMYHYRNQFYGTLVNKIETFFEDGGANRHTNPSPSYQIGLALSAGGYTYAPPPTPLTHLYLPLFGAAWTNQWDNPCYVQDPRAWNDIVGFAGQVGNLDDGETLGITPDGSNRNGVGISGEVVQARSNRDRTKALELWYADGASWVCEGIIKVAQTKRVAQPNIAELRRSDIFASWMLRWDTSRPVTDNLYQVKVITEVGRGVSVRWKDTGEVELYYNEYENKMPESKETRATVIWTGQLPSTSNITKVTAATLEQDGNTIRFRAGFRGGVIDSGKVPLPQNIHAPGGYDENLPAWAEIWVFNDAKNGRNMPRSGINGLQVSVIPDVQPYRGAFLEQVKNYYLWQPKVNLTPTSRIINNSVMPSLRDRTAGEVLKDLCEALALCWWIDSNGVAQVHPLESMTNRVMGTSRTLTATHDIGAFSLSNDLTQTCSRIEVEFANWAVSQTRKTQIDVWKKGGSIALGDTLEDFIQPKEEEEWLDLDTTVEDQGVRDWSWISDNNGSFYGGCTIVNRSVKAGVRSDLQQWEERYAASISCKAEVISPWVLKLTQRALSGVFVNTDTANVKSTTGKDIQLRTAQIDMRPGARVLLPHLYGYVVPDIELPIIRARGVMKRVKQKYTLSGGTPNARTLSLEGWDFIDQRGFAEEVTKVLSRYVMDAQPHFTNLEVPYDLSIVLGSVVTIKGMNEFGRENLFGAIVTGVVCGLEHDPAANKTSLTVWTFSYDKTFLTWDTIETNNDSGKRTWQQLEDTRQRQGTTWTKAENNPLL